MSPSCFFSDDDFDTISQMIDADLEPVFDHVQNGGTVVIPLDGLGTGLAKLDEKAPQVFQYLTERLAALEAAGA